MDPAGRDAARTVSHPGSPTPSCPALLPSSSCLCPYSPHTSFSYVPSRGDPCCQQLPNSLGAWSGFSTPPPMSVCLSLSPLWSPPPRSSLLNQSTVTEDRTMSLPLKGGVKPKGYTRDGSRLPAKEGRKGRVSMSALDAHSAPSSPPRALGQNASLQCGHQPSQLEECSPLPPAVPLCLFPSR